MSKLELYNSMAKKCDLNARHGRHPDTSAHWRSLAEDYRHLARIEREHPTPWYDLPEADSLDFRGRN